MIKLQIYNRQGVVWESKLKFIPDTVNPGLFNTLDDIYDFIDAMDIPHYKKTGYKNRLWVTVDWCHPKEFYRFVCS